ncbi:MAG: Serine/threonine protein kinase [Cyanobacteria bacterium RYN_339]|nr:Serine/threonine protein kinase [Cyanobacteria bacterium RYN_339]
MENDLVGDILANRYLIERSLGEGAMGQVWLVKDTTTGQTVALKVISKHIAHADRSVLEFIQEFRLMTQLRHQNCCEVADYGTLPDGQPYLTMEVVPGQGLDELLPINGERFEAVLSQILHALGYIHSRGFVHCDLKAANVRVRPDGVVKLMDYGLMEYAGRTDGPIKGTLAYMAPEMIKRGLIDRRADLYSVGCLAYELLTGRVPFPKDRPGDILRAHLGDRPVPPRMVNKAVDPRHEAIVVKLMAKDPIDRYQSADEVLEALGMGDASHSGGGLLTSPLMGRAQEMAKLFVHLARIVTGKAGGVVWLGGPAGSGKSRLFKEFGFNVQLENLPFAVGHCHEFAQTPYGPFLAVLRGLLPAFKESIADVFERNGPVLVKLLPELGFAPAPALEPASNEKLRLQTTIMELLIALARKRGVVLMLEDWQWADPLSRDCFDQIMRAMGEAPLLALVASRQPPPEGAPIKIASIALQPLAAAGVKRMIASMLGAPELEAPFVQPLIEMAEGNPYQVEMLLEHLVAIGVLVKEQGQWSAKGDLASDSLPRGLRALLASKISALPLGAQRVARVAAIFGYGFTLALMKEVAGTTDDELFQALGQLAQQQILVQDEEGRYRFAQDQFQVLVYAGIADVDKRELHAAVGRALEREANAADPADLPLETLTAITDQYLHAGQVEKIISYGLATGMRYLDLFANGPAETYLTAGLALLDPDDPAQMPGQLNFLRCLGDVLHRTGRVEAARERYDEAIGLAEALGDRFLLGRLLTNQAKIYQGLDELQLALEHGVRGARVSLGAGDPVGSARCLLVNARTRYYMGREADAIADLAEALELARATGDRASLGEALANIGYMYVATDSAKLGEGMACLNEAVVLLADVGDKQGVITSYSMLGQSQAKLGDYTATREAYALALDVARTVGNHPEICALQIGLASNALELGDFREAVELARSGAQEALNVQSTYQMGTGVAMEAFAQAHLGQFGEAKALMHVAIDLASELNHKVMEIRIQQYRAEILVLLGQLDEAAEAGERLQRLMRETGNLEPQARLYVLLAEIFGRQGDFDGAHEYLEAAHSIVTLGLVRGTQARVLKHKAWLAMRTGAWDGARTHGEAALALASSLGLKYLQAELEGLLGEVALATGTGDAAARFEAMAALAEAQGYALLAAFAAFGLAAAKPYAAESSLVAAQAGERLQALADTLDADQRQRFLAPPERQRVLEGNYIAFSLPIASKAAPSRNPEIWKMMDR